MVEEVDFKDIELKINGNKVSKRRLKKFPYVWLRIDPDESFFDDMYA